MKILLGKTIGGGGGGGGCPGPYVYAKFYQKKTGSDPLLHRIGTLASEDDKTQMCI